MKQGYRIPEINFILTITQPPGLQRTGVGKRYQQAISTAPSLTTTI